MLTLSPIKLLVVVVVVVVLLGPDKLPHAAKQIGAAWRSLRNLHQRVEQEVRDTIPDLPSTSEIARLARSPVAFLNQLADLPQQLHEDIPSQNGAVPSGASVRQDASSGPPGQVPADPSMN